MSKYSMIEFDNDFALAIERLNARIAEAELSVYKRTRELEQIPKADYRRNREDYAFNWCYPAHVYANYLHITQDRRELQWKNMSATHLMNTARLHVRFGRFNIAKAMWRYCAWREKAHR